MHADGNYERLLLHDEFITNMAVYLDLAQSCAEALASKPPWIFIFCTARKGYYLTPAHKILFPALLRSKTHLWIIIQDAELLIRIWFHLKHVILRVPSLRALDVQGPLPDDFMQACWASASRHLVVTINGEEVDINHEQFVTFLLGSLPRHQGPLYDFLQRDGDGRCKRRIWKFLN